MKRSARNQIKGTVVKISPGAVNSEVLIKTDGGEFLTAIITRESIQNLNLAEGKPVYAVIKASDVMLAVD